MLILRGLLSDSPCFPKAESGKLDIKAAYSVNMNIFRKNKFFLNHLQK